MIKREDIRIRDPFILTDRENQCYYMYGTTALEPHSIDAKNTFSVYRSYDLENFEEPKTIFDGEKTDAETEEQSVCRVTVTGLEENTSYLVRLTNGADTSEEITFTTGVAETLPNLSFDDWFQNGKVWYPYASGASPSVWDSANKGAATFIGSSTSPVEGTDAVKGKAAKMESKYAVIAFAAGKSKAGSSCEKWDAGV